MSETVQQSKSILHITPSTKDNSKYALIARELEIPYYPLENYHDLNLLSCETGMIYSVSIDTMDIHISQHLLES
jgi:hypothetical protein